MAHILVVGATGMLREAVLHLAHLGVRVSALARTWHRLNLLRAAAGHSRGIVNPLALDYRDIPTLRAAVLSSVRELGPLDSAIAWVRSDSSATLRAVADCLGRPGWLLAGEHATAEAPLARCDFLHLLGSADHNPLHVSSPISKELQSLSHIAYRRIILGFMTSQAGPAPSASHTAHSRWLKDSEISQGVINALQSTAHTVIIGQIDPWSRRPSS